jgi:uncharacterized protein YlxW (UPF0749 family)
VETLVITWRELLIVVVLVLAVYIAEVLLLTRSPGRRGFSLGRDKAEEASQNEVRSLRADCEALREQLDKLQGEVDEMKLSQASTPYSQAIKLAQEGLNAAQIAGNCGISRGEAELVVALYHANQT